VKNSNSANTAKPITAGHKYVRHVVPFAALRDDGPNDGFASPGFAGVSTAWLPVAPAPPRLGAVPAPAPLDPTALGAVQSGTGVAAGRASGVWNTRGGDAVAVNTSAPLM
jgi:hypothetical protein